MTKTWMLLAVLLFGVARSTIAAPLMYVHDSAGRLAKVDVVTGAVTPIGSMGLTMTDIAFDPSGQLFGISFSGLYAIDPLTAAVTFLGNHGISQANALVFGADGTLYAAGGGSLSLFTLNPSNGGATNLGGTGFASGGDLAFYSGSLYLADISSRLVHIDLGMLSNSALVGSFGVSDVYGLATGEDGVLYGVGGTQIFTVNATTGQGTNPINFGGQGLGQAFGQSFRAEAGAPPDPTDPTDPVPVVPEPASLMLLGTGLAGLARLRYSNSRSAARHAGPRNHGRRWFV